MGKTIKDVFDTVEYNGVEYRLYFNLNVIEVLQETYGSAQKWVETINSVEDEGDAKALKFGFREMINEGIDIMNEENGTDLKPLTLKQVGRLLTEVGLASATEKMSKLVFDSSQSTDEKNA